MARGIWEVVGGSDKGGILVRTGKDLPSSGCCGRLSTGALLEELEREGDRLRYKQLSGSGPLEGWVSMKLRSSNLLARPSGLWEVVGGSSKGGIRVRSGSEANSPLLEERLATGAMVRELELKDTRLKFFRLTGTGPETGWVSICLNDGKPLMSKFKFPTDLQLDLTAAAAAATGSVPSTSSGGGSELQSLRYKGEAQFSYAASPPWVPRAAAVARLLRENRPYLPSKHERLPRLNNAKPLAPFKRLTPKQLEDMSKQNLPGCLFGLTFPKTADEMKSTEFGADWLTKAFHAAGTLPAENRIVRLVRAEPLPVNGFDAAGGAAMKMFLTVEYLKEDPELHTELFCKYPYLYTEYPNERRDLSCYGDADGPEIACQMSLAHLFPFRTAKFYFGEVCRETTNFILISETIPFSKRGRVENGKVVEHIDYKPYEILPVCGKYQDWLLPNPAEYYCCLFRAMGQLAAWDKQGSYDSFFGPFLPWTEEQHLERTQAERRLQTEGQVEGQRRTVGKVLDMAIDFMTNVVPSMMPSFMLEEGRLEKVKKELLEMFPHFRGMSGHYQWNNPDYVAAMHVNLQADNAFFWRDEYGDLACGVLDWGGFSRSAFCLNFLGCLAGADPDVLMAHEEGIIRCFRDEYHRCGGPLLALDELRSRYHLAFITFVYESTTWIERDIYKQTTKEELKTWSGILDERFQAAFRVRCRTCTIINAFTVYSLRGDHFKKAFDGWSKGKGARYLTQIKS
eukprot:TRINITY_DN40760_c0_g1_i1.p1 TRINITY_DN40760_c0_g1~~TRINITY_DN40760_c0_g1_i1.p1  ORF type:complete len:738 (-),score=146.31 TRINITY_DN40760_c0_g1_i1:36-2249(-)